MPVLELVERVVVLKDGMLVMDAPKARALNNSRMQQQQQATGREWKMKISQRDVAAVEDLDNALDSESGYTGARRIVFFSC